MPIASARRRSSQTHHPNWTQPRHWPALMQFPVAVDQAVCLSSPPGSRLLALGRRSARCRPLSPTRCPSEGYQTSGGIELVIVEFQLIIEQHLEHHIQGLIKQSALDGVVVVLQEAAHPLVRFFQLLQGEGNQPPQLADGQLPGTELALGTFTSYLCAGAAKLNRRAVSFLLFVGAPR